MPPQPEKISEAINDQTEALCDKLDAIVSALEAISYDVYEARKVFEDMAGDICGVCGKYYGSHVQHSE